MTDRCGGVLVEVEAARDLSAALAAHLLELAQAVAAAGHDRTQVAGPCGERAVRRHRAPEEAQRLAGGEIGAAVRALDVEVAGPVSGQARARARR